MNLTLNDSRLGQYDVFLNGFSIFYCIYKEKRFFGFNIEKITQGQTRGVSFSSHSASLSESVRLRNESAWIKTSANNENSVKNVEVSKNKKRIKPSQWVPSNDAYLIRE